MSAKIADIRRSYVDGEFVTGEGPSLAVENPATEETVAEVETLSLAQIEEAVLAARRAFDGGEWSGLRREERIDAVLALGEYLDGRSEELGATLAAEAGSTASMLGAQVAMPLAHLRGGVRHLPHHARRRAHAPPAGRGDPRQPRDREHDALRADRRRRARSPPYNFPLQTPLWKFVPALLTGSTVVLRPSPLTPIATLVIGEAAEAVGLPAGVLNVVVEGGRRGRPAPVVAPRGRLRELHRLHHGRQGDHGPGGADGEAGAARAGRQVGASCISTTWSTGRRWGARRVFAAHSGQACVAPTRMLVPEERKAEVLEQAAGVAGMLKVGDPTDAATMVGPLISAAQRERCERYVAAAVDAGATVVCGGTRPEALDRGYYFEPTVLDVPDNSNPAAQDEIFGPVICVIGYRDVDHAVEIANDSVYGLAGQVFGGNLAEAVAVAERIRAGAVSA